MKKILLSGLLLINLSLFSQVNNEKEFVEFGTSSPKDQQAKMMQSGWQATQPKTWTEDGTINEQHEYGKKINGVPFMLRILYKTDKDFNQMKSTKVIFTDVTTYNSWVANLKKQGYIFKEYEKGSFVAKEEDYAVYYGKKSTKILTIYEFEVISF